MYCKRCKKLLGYKSYAAEVEREEPERYCGGCAPSNPPVAGATFPGKHRDHAPFSKGDKERIGQWQMVRLWRMS
jgi:hypothetical protein